MQTQEVNKLTTQEVLCLPGGTVIENIEFGSFWLIGILSTNLNAAIFLINLNTGRVLSSREGNILEGPWKVRNNAKCTF